MNPQNILLKLQWEIQNILHSINVYSPSIFPFKKYIVSQKYITNEITGLKSFPFKSSDLTQSCSLYFIFLCFYFFFFYSALPFFSSTFVKTFFFNYSLLSLLSAERSSRCQNEADC